MRLAIYAAAGHAWCEFDQHAMPLADVCHQQQALFFPHPPADVFLNGLLLLL